MRLQTLIYPFSTFPLKMHTCSMPYQNETLARIRISVFVYIFWSQESLTLVHPRWLTGLRRACFRETLVGYRKHKKKFTVKVYPYPVSSVVCLLMRSSSTKPAELLFIIVTVYKKIESSRKKYIMLCSGRDLGKRRVGFYFGAKNDEKLYPLDIFPFLLFLLQK